MLRPLRSNRGGRTARAPSWPPPYGGLNKRDPVDRMAATDASHLVNWIPRDFGLISRPGSVAFADTSESGADVQQLIGHDESGTVLAAVNGKIFDVSGGGATSLATGLTSQYWQSVEHSSVRFLANGVDNLKVFDGSTIADATFTGETLSNIKYVHHHGSRFYGVVKNSKRFVYGGAEAITGALTTTFDLGQTGPFRGDLFAIASISRDGGAGSDDYLCFIFEDGRVAVYSGTDPAASFARVGLFRIGRPLSRLAIMQADADVLVLTERGVERLSLVLSAGRLALSATMLTDKIRDDVATHIRDIGSTDAWRLDHLAPERLIILTVPQATGTFQYAYETDRGAWTRFDLPAISWATSAGEMYFGLGGGLVRKFDPTVPDDLEQTIIADAITSSNYFGDREHLKHIQLARPVFKAGYLPPVRISIAGDFAEPELGAYYIGSPTGSGATDWGSAEAEWGVAQWGDQPLPRPYHAAAVGLGTSLAMRVQAEVGTDRLQWMSTQAISNRGGLIP